VSDDQALQLLESKPHLVAKLKETTAADWAKFMKGLSDRELRKLLLSNPTSDTITTNVKKLLNIEVQKKERL